MEVLRKHKDVWIAPKKNQPWKSPDIILKYENSFPNIGNELDQQHAYLNFHCLVSVVRNCELPTMCQEVMMHDVYSQTQHMLTDQLLLLQFAEQRSCMQDEKNREIFNNWIETRDILCAKAYQESELNARKNYLIPMRKLDGKNTIRCGSAGYPNFFRSDWLTESLSRQSKGSQGCFRHFESDFRTTEKIINVANDINGKPFTEACLTRTTSKLLELLALYMRYMVDNCSSAIFRDVNSEV